MRVTVHGRDTRLRDDQLLGIGGEAKVYALNEREALKIWHTEDAGERRLRAAKAQSFPSKLPTELVAPQSLVSNPQGEVVGFTMRRVSGRALGRLLGRPERLTSGMPALVTMLRRLHRIVSELHAKGLLVGDLNDGNVLVEPDGTPWLIDADSLQLPGFPCVVAHERFLDPRLYGIDLAHSAALDRSSDWYAYAVIAFMTLLGVHPYGGVHQDHPTLLRRAAAGISVLRPEVLYPKAARPLETLPRPIREYFSRVFDEGLREPFPVALVPTRWEHCGCGLIHARRRCPHCARPERGATERTIRRGRCVARRVLRTAGRVLAAAPGRRLSWLVDHGDVLIREDGTRIPTPGGQGELSAILAGRSTWIAQDRRVQEWVGDAKGVRLSTHIFEGAPVFASAGPYAWHLSEGWLREARAGRRVGQVMPGQTWFDAGPHLGVGFWRAANFTYWFCFEPGRGGFKRLDLPSLGNERLREVRALKSGHKILVHLALEAAGGRRHHRIHLVDARRGLCLCARDLSPDDPAVHIEAFRGDRFLSVADDGLQVLAFDPARARFVPHARFVETAEFVSEDAQLIPDSGSGLWVVRPHAIHHLTLSQP